MPVGKGPWDSRPPGGARGWLWIALAVAGIGALFFLFRLFPGQSYTEWDWANLVWFVVLLTVASTAILSARHFKLRETARNIAIWGGIAMVLVLAYTFQDDLGRIWMRVKAEFLPGTAVETSAHVVTLTENSDGNYYVFADVQGTQVKFLVDTGASDIVLSPSDAKRAGIDVSLLTFEPGFETANGLGRGARVILASVAIGPIHFSNVSAWVNGTEMRTSLLGMSFLKRLDGFEFQGRRMLLRWR